MVDWPPTMWTTDGGEQGQALVHETNATFNIVLVLNAATPVNTCEATPVNTCQLWCKE